MTVKEAALEYIKLEMSVIPIRGPAYTFGDTEEKKYKMSKTPLLKSWEEFQRRQPTAEEIEEWFKIWPEANIAIITGKVSDAVVIDCDTDEALAYFKENYTGQTVSSKGKRGCHYYFQYEQDVTCAAKLFGIGMDVKSEGGYVIAPPSKIYTNGSGNQQYYEWVNSILKEDIEKDVLKSLSFSLYRGVVDSGYKVSTNVHNSQQTSTMFSELRKDNDLFHTANCLAKGYMPEGEIEQVLLAIMKSWGEYDEKWARSKVKSVITRIERKERNLAEEVLEYILSTTGHFLSTDIAKCLHLSTRQELKNLSMILKRYCDKGIIEKVGERNGCWRKVDTDLEIINWQTADEKEYPIDFPLGLSSLVKLYPGNIVVLAGASNTGKTSFMLETIRLNQKHHEIFYFNSEMGASELKIRLNQFPENLIKFNPWKFTAIERSSNFADVIKPDAMNVIDFMEVYDEFYKIGGWIRDVHSKLKTGIAIIAIQKKASTKNFNQQFGRGGELTLEKPRLYLSMDRGRIEIVKAKIWKNHEVNPNGMVRRFNLIGGCEFKPIKNNVWEVEGEKYTGFSSEASRYEQD